MSDEAPTHKRCTKCGELKPFDAFAKEKHGKYGLRGDCKICFKAAYREKGRERQKARYQADPETARAYARTRYRNNPKLRQQKQDYARANAEQIKKKVRERAVKNREHIRQRQHAYNTANMDRIREWRRQYTIANAEKIRAYLRVYHEINREKLIEWTLSYRQANPDVHRTSNQKRRARIKGNGGTFTTAELKAMRIEYAGVCFYCRGQHEPDELTIDHVIPIDQGGRHEAANIVLACGICNSSKGNRRPEQWVDRWYERKQRAKRK